MLAGGETVRFMKEIKGWGGASRAGGDFCKNAMTECGLACQGSQTKPKRTIRLSINTDKSK